MQWRNLIFDPIGSRGRVRAELEKHRAARQMAVCCGVMQSREPVLAIAELEPGRDAAGVGGHDQGLTERKVAVLGCVETAAQLRT